MNSTDRDYPELGDELCPRPLITMTRSIVIDAPPEAVWPWVAQIGQNRGGFYSFTWLENLMGARIANATRIHPKFQLRETGEVVTIHPDLAPFHVASIDPPHALVLYGEEGAVARTSWAFTLSEIEGGRTRLTARMRIDRGERGGVGRLAYSLFLQVILRPGHALMEGRMLRGIRRRATAPHSQD